MSGPRSYQQRIATTTTDAIRGMTDEQRRLFLRYGDHARACAWRRAMEDAGRNGSWTKLPDCDCGWLEALKEACGSEA